MYCYERKQFVSYQEFRKISGISSRLMTMTPVNGTDRKHVTGEPPRKNKFGVRLGMTSREAHGSRHS